ncbi:MAG: nucleotidyltransferase family protein [Chitinophagaceae bacterium]|nr:nucleotidyltransferase family protein [Chitinophagaceae bacterium]
MISTAIILAGGLGTRLRTVVADIPKCMAPVAGNPFLKYVIEYLLNQGVTHFIFSVGYKKESIIEFVQQEYPHLNYRFAIEEEPLGTGGAVHLAASLCKEKNSFVLNADTIFKVNLSALSSFHYLNDADCTLSLKPMQQFERYGAVELNEEQRVMDFKEKKYYDSGLINGGVYALNVDRFLKMSLPQKFSFEKNYLEAYYRELRLFGYSSDAYFIDIGIPEDYERAQTELA